MRASGPSSSQQQGAGARFRKVQPMLAYLSQNLEEQPSLDWLAQQAKLSKFHLHRLFTETAGETPKQYSLRLRLGRAAVLLLTTEVSVLDVALACGFNSVEPAMRVVDDSTIPAKPSPSEGGLDVQIRSLPAGPAAVTVHAGAYDSLQQAYMALEQWIRAEGYTPAAGPWEAYLTDPTHHPDPADWRTEVYWPLKQD